MPQEALVCPHCRTWVEASGRSVRCPACGKRFRADEARLGARGAAPETTDFSRVEAPARGEVLSDNLDAWSRDERMYGKDERERTSQHTLQSETRRRQPVQDRALEWRDQVDRLPPEEFETEGVTDERQATEQAAEGGLNIGVLFTVALILLFIFGRQFLGAEAFIGAIVALIAGRWLYDRWKGSKARSEQ